MWARCWRRCSFQLALASSVLVGGAIWAVAQITYFGDCAYAQIVPDSTLPNNSTVTPFGNTNVITSGTQAGSNLFHSFEQFSVPTGSVAYFNNALDIQNIISRVTGGSVSNIDGLLRTNGTAKLFLLNPNGIIFGPNATLAIGGSFVASTASSLNFSDGTQFSTTDPQTTPLLTVSVPIGLQLGGTRSPLWGLGGTARSILNQSQTTNSSGEVVGLQVQPSQTLALVGGDVSLDGGNLQAQGGLVELGGLAGAGTVGLNIDGNNLSLSFPVGVQRADVSLTNGASVDVTAGGGGSIAVNAQNLDISGGSYLDAGIRPGLGAVGSQAGDITLNATGSMSIADSLIGSRVRTGSVGNGSNINIQASSLSLTDGAAVIASTFEQGNAGSVNINARNTVSLDGVSSDGFSSGAFSSVGFGAVGNGGDVNLTAGSLSLTNGAQVSASTFGQGNAGSVNINARNTVSFDGIGSNGFSSGVFSAVESGAVGNGGGVNLTAGSLSLTNGAQVSTSTFGEGNSGNLSVRTLDAVELIGTSADGQFTSGLLASAEGAGRAGNLTIATGLLNVRDGAEVNVSSEGTGDAGSLEVTARSIRLDNQGQLTATTRSGNGGNITLEVQDLLLLRRNSQISTTAGTAQASGNGGNFFIDAQFIVAVPSENSDITTNAFTGRGGNINITAQGIFGTQFREQLTPESDIVATGKTGLDLPNSVYLNLGLVALPAELVDASNQIATSCAALGENKFIITGRGGLPPSPSDPFSSDALWIDWGTLNPKVENNSSPPVSTNPTAPESAPIVEALLVGD